ncbi:MAG: 4-oxalomesaconate tautomerase [Alphaproteobacteria bacterium]|nr:MAG: 4-oxalomesaconate tautomerase [Alphaproteobacteria bacterium]
MQTAIPALFMRGGTSRGLYFEAGDLPPDATARDRLLLAAMGSPDARQIDGMGGATPLTSKVAIVGPSDEPGIDVDYLFAQVLVEENMVDTGPTCGNILAGVGPFAIERGLVAAADGETRVRIRLVNTGDLVEAVFQTPGGAVQYAGSATIDGVPGSAAPVILNFIDCLGAKTGALFPTGNVADRIDGIPVTLADAAMPVMMMRAEDMGKTGYETAEELDNDTDFFARLEAIRLAAGEMMGLGDVTKMVIPKPVLLAPARHGGTLNSRYFTPHATHEAHAVTGAICLAVAAVTPGTLAHEFARIEIGEKMAITIEHPTGTIDVALTLDLSQTPPAVKSAGILRTARLLFQGAVMVPEGTLEGAQAAAGETP